MKRKPKTPERRRIRLEFSVYPTANRTVAMNCDRKITALRVLLKERFDGAGEKLFSDWADLCRHDVESRSLATVWSASNA